MTHSYVNNKRIAKNTILLYIRTIIILLVSLYASRVILDALGVKDYGIYNVVGGVVAMFSLVSGSLSSAISRFITFELGKGKIDKLHVIFCTSINIQIGISFIVFVLGVTIGLWFVNTGMNIPAGRMEAANWVFVCSLLMFCINLIIVPYNACIVAHECMNAFAYISILDAFLKLGICFLIKSSPFDRLVSYAALLVFVPIINYFIYRIYCRRKFSECHYKFIHDKGQLKSMAGFAGWSFLTNTCYMFNTQGVNILINIFFDVTVNAARGIATQVESAIMQFVNNFTIAINPQITKSYAAGRKEEMFLLVCRGAKFSYFLLLIFALPVMLETEYLLSLWLTEVPEKATVFLRLTIVASMFNMIGNTGLTACQATGNIKRYVIWISSVGCLVFPLTWLAFRLGLPSESTYIVFAIVYILVEVVRLYIMRGLLQFPIKLFVRDVIYKICFVTAVAVVVPYLVNYYMDTSFAGFLIVIFVSVLSSTLSIYSFGLSHNERTLVKQKCSAIVMKAIGKLRNEP